MLEFKKMKYIFITRNTDLISIKLVDAMIYFIKNIGFIFGLMGGIISLYINSYIIAIIFHILCFCGWLIFCERHFINSGYNTSEYDS